MKGFILLVLGVILAIFVVGTVAFNFLDDVGTDSETNSGSLNKLSDKVSNIASSGSSNSDNSIIDEVSDIVSEEVKSNYQNGEGSYREVTYKDGGFRQYDTESGNLIGSSYDSDQDKIGI